MKVGVDRPIDTRAGDRRRDRGQPMCAQRLRDTRILLIGESHTSRESHRVQFQVIEALHRAGRRVIIGLEMYPYTAQPALDRWSRGAVGGPAPMSEEAFIKESAWYLHWGLHFGYYRDIFLFARDNGLRMVGVNAPRDVIAAVRKKGLRNLTPEEARQIPADIDADNAEHLTLFKTYFGGGDATHGGRRGGTSESVWKDMLGAQAAWDATMAFHAVKAWREAKDERAIVVVLVGSGHARVRPWHRAPGAAIVRRRGVEHHPCRDREGREGRRERRNGAGARLLRRHRVGRAGANRISRIRRSASRQ